MSELPIEGARRERVVQLECNLDDMTGEELGFVLEQLLEAGALDAWFTPIYMKKNRPAVLLGVLCRPEEAEAFQALLLRATSTLGVRWCEMERLALERRTVHVATPWGQVPCKAKLMGGRVVSIKPEYEACARLAREYGLTLRQVEEAVQASWQASERAEGTADVG